MSIKKLQKINIYWSATIFVTAVIITFFFLGSFLEDLFVPPLITTYGIISFRLFISFFLYTLFLLSITNKPDKRRNRILFYLYLHLLIAFSLSRPYIGSNINNIFLRLGKVYGNTLYVILANLLVYVPIGCYIKKAVNIRIIYLFTAFILYIILIEGLQFFLRVGFFDINDIVLNAAGFMLGVSLTIVFQKLKLSLSG